MNQDLRSKLASTEMLILDVDGVLTDGRLFYGTGGIEIKAFNVHDGFGLKKIQQKGISVAIVSGRESDIVEKRANELGIRFLFQNIAEKKEVLPELHQRSGIEPQHMAMSEMIYPTWNCLRASVLGSPSPTRFSKCGKAPISLRRQKVARAPYEKCANFCLRYRPTQTNDPLVRNWWTGSHRVYCL